MTKRIAVEKTCKSKFTFNILGIFNDKINENNMYLNKQTWAISNHIKVHISNTSLTMLSCKLILMKLLEDKRGNCNVIKPSDCEDWYNEGYRNNRVYKIYPDGKTGFDVYCDMKTDGGGWTVKSYSTNDPKQKLKYSKYRCNKLTFCSGRFLNGPNSFLFKLEQHLNQVIQRRFNGKTDFDRTWEEYKHGFGKRSEEYWLGNDKIHLLTKRNYYKLRVDMEDFKGVHKYASYSTFSVRSESSGYVLNVGGYNGTAGIYRYQPSTKHLKEQLIV
ncbi:hypothetical protein KUTeg_010891 [Tegillarca granosa]|uniref:Fibrinogen C-terminal domain-containing protein n=1 Tax=Tegillarca granosa TaxID=220873 RepID=A0ABQ9F4N0_TEGGR|nr:hypothetical protein KUTeg_010891 [Tegillarca granosa]